MFTFNDYSQMKLDFASQIKGILVHKGLTRVEELERRQQVQFVQRLIAQLDDYKPKVDKSDEAPNLRAKILTGCMYVISDEINQTYTGSFLPLLQATRSEVYSALQVAMGITPSNKLEALCKRNMLDLSEFFIVSLIHHDGKLGKDLRLDHPFVDVADFNLESFLLRLVKLKADASTDLIHEQFAKFVATKEQTKQPATESVRSTLLSTFWKSSAQPSADISSSVESSTSASSIKAESFPPLAGPAPVIHRQSK